MKIFSIITLTLVLLVGTSFGAMEAGKIAAVDARAESDNIVVPITLNNNLAMTALEIPLKFSEGVTLNEVSFEGTRSEDFDLKVAKIDNENNTVVIALIPMVYGENTSLAPGKGTIANLEFSIDDTGLENINLTRTTMKSPTHELMFVYLNDDKTMVDLKPEFSDITIALSQINGNTLTIPTSFDLKQNAPNPFNPTTRINYDLPKATHVNLTVFNVLGQTVTTLKDGFMEAGSHSITWNGTDNGGATVASGIYFYRIEADDFQATKKMMMLK